MVLDLIYLDIAEILIILAYHHNIEKIAHQSKIYIRASSLPSSNRAASTDFPDSLSPFLPIVYCSWQVF